jgi:hypothetical protein
MTIDELIARLESAAEGSRDFDYRIAQVIGNKWMEGVREGDSPPFAPRSIADRTIPRYTTSVDAALTLVPDGWVVANISQNDNRLWWTCLNRGYRTSYDATAIAGDLATPALAVCVAALRARTADRAQP